MPCPRHLILIYTPHSHSVHRLTGEENRPEIFHGVLLLYGLGLIMVTTCHALDLGRFDG